MSNMNPEIYFLNAARRFPSPSAASASWLLGERPPDRDRLGDLLDFGGEGLDHDQPREADVAERRCDVAPGQMVVAGRPAIVRTGVELDDAPRGASDRGGNVLLLDVHMESVEEQADVVGFDVIKQAPPSSV